MRQDATAFVEMDVQCYWAEAQQWRASLSLERGEVLAVYGASGVGKTTLLRVLAGLSQMGRGTLRVGGTCWQDSERGVYYTPQQRRAGVVFQDYALFPHWTALQQLRYASKDEALIQELLHAVGLEDLQHRRPAQLSGGQQQRLALIRALVTQPQLLLLDEPFAALDPPLRQAAQRLLLQLHQRFQGVTVLVSHDVAEILTLAHRLLVITPQQACLHENPTAYFEGEGLWQAWEGTAVVVAITPTQLEVERNGRRQWLAKTTDLEGVAVGDRLALWGGQRTLGVKRL